MGEKVKKALLETWNSGCWGWAMPHPHSTSHPDKKQDLCLPDGRTEADTLLPGHKLRRVELGFQCRNLGRQIFKRDCWDDY